MPPIRKGVIILMSVSMLMSFVELLLAALSKYHGDDGGVEGSAVKQTAVAAATAPVMLGPGAPQRLWCAK